MAPDPGSDEGMHNACSPADQSAMSRSKILREGWGKGRRLLSLCVCAPGAVRFDLGTIDNPLLFDCGTWGVSWSSKMSQNVALSESELRAVLKERCWSGTAKKKSIGMNQILNRCRGIANGCSMRQIRKRCMLSGDKVKIWNLCATSEPVLRGRWTRVLMRSVLS